MVDIEVTLYVKAKDSNGKWGPCYNEDSVVAIQNNLEDQFEGFEIAVDLKMQHVDGLEKKVNIDVEDVNVEDVEAVIEHTEF